MPEIRGPFSRFDPLRATQDVVVSDPLTGRQRKLFAGERVPYDLVAAYEEATTKKRSSRKKSSK